MAVNLTEKTAEQLPDIDGIALYTAQAGVKKPGHTDLTLIAVAAGSTVGAVFTTNRFCAAPSTSPNRTFSTKTACAPSSSTRATPTRVRAHRAESMLWQCVPPPPGKSAANRTR